MRSLYALSLVAALPLAAAISAEDFPRYTGNSVCAASTGDPHVTTFDKVKYDCQAEGEVILSKSLQTSFELQGRFEKVPSKSVSTTQGLVLKTGTAGEPMLEISYTKSCDLSYFLDGSEIDLEKDPDTKYDNFLYYAKNSDRYFMYASGVELKINLRKYLGDCLLNTYLCIPESLSKKKIVGILGSPDSKPDNDFMKRDGGLYTPEPKSRHAKNEYCKSAWCVPSLEANLFKDGTTACGPMKPPAETVAQPEFKCGDMQVDTKCPYEHGDRLYRLEKQTFDSCRQACLDHKDCGYYSFSPPGSKSGFEGVCMGCSAAGAREPHKGFNFYSKECVGDQIPGPLDNMVTDATPEIKAKCQGDEGCIIDTVVAGNNLEEGLRTLEDQKAPPKAPPMQEIIDNPKPPVGMPAPPKKKHEEPADKSPPAPTGPVCSNSKFQFGVTKDCLKCATRSDDGTVVIDASACKGSAVSWMCCTGTDLGSGASYCPVSGSPFAKGSGKENKMNEVLTITLTGVAADATEVHIQAHDGINEGVAPSNVDVCGGNGNGAGTCTGITDTIVSLSGCAAVTKATDPPPTTPKAVVPPPTDDPMTPTSNPGTKGDPHFKTHGGEMFDFHGGCDLVLLDNPDFKDGLGLTIHVRTRIVTWWSYVESVAVKIGDDVMVMTGAQDEERWLFLNGEAIDDVEAGKFHFGTLGGFVLRYKHQEKRFKNREAHIHFDSDEKIMIKTFNEFLKVEFMNESEGTLGGSHGILGTYPEGKRVARDGETVIENVNAYGQEWQVTVEEPKLFMDYSADWVVPAGHQCAMPEETLQKAALRKRRLQGGLSEEEAAKACGHLSGDDKKACIYDVLATQDTNMASVW